MNATKLSAEVLSDLSRRASFVFSGVVTAVGKCNLDGVEPDKRMAMVRVDDVILSPQVLGDLKGKTLTIYLESPSGVRQGTRATFFATSWHYGRNIGVIEIGRTSMKPAELRQSVIEERLRDEDAHLMARIQRAELIISGRVISAFHTDRKDLPGMDEGIDWYEAEMWVGTVEKGRPPKQLYIFYPVGGDREWGPVPKAHPGQVGVWLLGPVAEPDEEERKPKARGRKGKEGSREDSKLMALDPLDYQAISALPRVRFLLLKLREQ